MLRSTRAVTVLGVAVQAVGFLRTVIIAAALGVSLDVDAYNLALVAPTFISTVIGGWLQVSFVGRYAGLVATDDEHLAAAYRARMLMLVLACALLSSALCFLFPEKIMAFFMPASQTSMSTSAASALHVAGWILIPVIIGDFLGLILNSHGLFFAAALAPLINALISVICLWLWRTPDLAALVWTLLLGAIGQFTVIAIALGRLRLDYPFFRTGPAKSEVRTSLMLALPLLPAIMLSNAMSPMVQFRAAELGEGTVSIYGYAFRLHGAVTQILIIGLATVLLPHFAALWSRNEKQEIIALLRKLARATVFVAIYLGLGIYQMGDLAIGILLRRGQFNQEMTHQVALIWAVLSLSLFPFAFGTYIAKLGQAMRQVFLILITSAASFAATWLMTSTGASMQDFVFICLAPTAAVSASMIVWLLWLKTKLPIRMLLRDIVNAACRSAIILGPALLLDEKLELLMKGASELLALLLRGCTFTLIAAALLWLLGWYRWFLAKTPKPEELAAASGSI